MQRAEGQRQSNITKTKKKKKKKTGIDPQKLRFALKYIYFGSPPLKYLYIDPQEIKNKKKKKNPGPFNSRIIRKSISLNELNCLKYNINNLWTI